MRRGVEFLRICERQFGFIVWLLAKMRKMQKKLFQG